MPAIFNTNVTDQQLVVAFERTNFGTADHRKTLEQGILQVACGYSTGGTLFRIMVNLGLVTRKNNVTKKGREFMFAAFHQDSY